MDITVKIGYNKCNNALNRKNMNGKKWTDSIIKTWIV